MSTLSGQKYYEQMLKKKNKKLKRRLSAANEEIQTLQAEVERLEEKVGQYRSQAIERMWPDINKEG